jgi:hypothetical protein
MDSGLSRFAAVPRRFRESRQPASARSSSSRTSVRQALTGIPLKKSFQRLGGRMPNTGNSANCMTRAQPERWPRSGSLCAEVGTGRAVISPRPFPRSGSLPPLLFGQFFLDEAEHFLQNRMASVATLRGYSGSSRNAVRLSFGNSVRLRRNPQVNLTELQSWRTCTHFRRRSAAC